MSNESYARQKLYEAVHALVGSASIHERLERAANHLAVVRLANQYPENVRERADRLTRALMEPSGQGSAQVVGHLTDEEGESLAREILSIFVVAMGGL